MATNLFGWKVRLSEGSEYGPIDLNTLKQWVFEGRVDGPDKVYDPMTGKWLCASDADVLLEVFDSRDMMEGKVEIDTGKGATDSPERSGLYTHSTPQKAGSGTGKASAADINLFPLPLEGISQKEISHREQTAVNLREMLNTVLLPREKPLFLAEAQRNVTFTEGVLSVAGLLSFLFLSRKKHVLIFTDMRILQIRIDKDGKPQVIGHSQILYPHIRSIKLSIRRFLPSRRVKVIFWNHRKLIWKKVSRYDRQQLYQIRETLLGKHPLPTSYSKKTVVIQPLCSVCYQLLVDGVYTCSNCNSTFKSPLHAMLFSLLIPGAGLFYVRNASMGFLVVFWELFLAVGLLGIIIGVIPTGNTKQTPLIIAIAALLLILLKFISMWYSKRGAKEYIPR